MAFLLGPKEKKSRAVGENLFLKAERSFSQKSAMVKRPYRPGAHGKSRRSLSEYGQQLLEKQKLRLSYGLRERQLEKYIEKALSQHKVSSSEALIRTLETRLDNVVFRLGLASSRSIARILVSHGHIIVNGRKTDIPSMQLRPNDVVMIRPQSKTKKVFENLEERLKKYTPPAWLALEKNMEGKIIKWPAVEEVGLPFNVSRIFEFYSR